MEQEVVDVVAQTLPYLNNQETRYGALAVLVLTIIYRIQKRRKARKGK